MKKFTLSFLLCALSFTASAQWSNDITENNALTDGSHTIYSQDAKANNDGITYLFYNSPKDGNTASYLQIFDKEGLPTIDGDGMLISDTLTRTYDMVNDRLFIDNNGDAILVVSDCRNSDEETKNLTYAVYKVSPEGEMLWSKDGVDLYKGRSTDLAADMKIRQLEDGSYVFVWLEITGLASDGSELQGIRAERLDSNGDFCWDEALTINDSNNIYSYPYIENAGSNQFILIYAQGGNQTLYARKVDFDGSSVWGEDTKVYVGGFNSTVPLHTQMTTAYDPNGGIFIGWNADPMYTGCESAYITYVQADGTLKFVEGTAGLPVSYSETMRSMNVDLAYSKTDDCVYVAWRGLGKDAQSYQSINIQKVSLQGELMWGTEGKYVMPIDIHQFSAPIVQDTKEGGFGLFFMNFLNLDTDSYAFRYNNEGEPVWENGAYQFSPTDGYKGALTVSELVNDEYWLATWEEEFDDLHGNVVFAERIYTTGPSTDGISNTTSDSKQFAAKAINGTVYFATSFSNDSAATVTLYAASGECVGTTTIAAGSNNASYSTAGLAAGVYIATLTNGTVATSTRLVIQ